MTSNMNPFGDVITHVHVRQVKKYIDLLQN